MEFLTESGYRVAEVRATAIIMAAARALTFAQIKLMAKGIKRNHKDGRVSFAPPNPTALELLEGKQRALLEDLTSETQLYLLHEIAEGNIFFNDLVLTVEGAEAERLIFPKDETYYNFFKTIRAFLYQSAYKHKRKEAFSLDDEGAECIIGLEGVEMESITSDLAATLPAPQAEVFIYLQAGYTQAEICEHLNLSNGTASRLILKVKHALLSFCAE